MRVAIVTAAAALLTLAGVLAMPRGLASGDEGVKLIEAQSWPSRALTYPAGQMDPEGRFFPLRPPFAFRRDAKWYGLYPVPFPAVSKLAWKLGGFRGIFILPWLAAVASVALAGLLARSALVAALAALTTPLLIYGTLHWEHSLAVAMVLGALLALRTPTWPRIVVAGLLIGAGPAIRTELYCVPAAAIMFVLLAWPAREWWRLLVSGAVAIGVVVAFWLWNLRAVGMWDPVVLVNRGFLTNQPQKWDGFALLFAQAPHVWPLVALALGAGLLPGRLGIVAVLAACAWAAGLSIRALVTNHDPTLTGFLLVSPILILGLPLRKNPYAAAGIALVAAMMATDLARIAGGGGLQFGSRYLLPAAPLLLIGAVELVRGSRLLVPTAAALALISIAATGLNVRNEAILRARNARLVAAVEQSGARDVITHLFWVPQVLAPLWSSHRIYAWSDDKLFERLLDHGITSVVRVHGGITELHEPKLLVQPAQVLDDAVVVYSLGRSDEP
jgi:hypothetical protein